jgi:HEAT repeat protein
MKAVKKLSLIGLWIILIHLLLISPVFSQTGNTNPTPPDTIQPDTPIIEHYYQWIDMGEAAIPELKQAIKSDNWRMRTHALLAMGKTGNQALTPLVLDRLNNDDNTAVKNCAVMALGDLKETSAVPVLIELLTTGHTTAQKKPRPQQRAVIQSLGKIGDPRAIAPLFDLLLSTKTEQSRIEIANALIAINDPGISQLILAKTSGSKSDPKFNLEKFPYVQAAQITGALPVDGAEDFLIGLMKDKPLPIKNAAIFSLGSIQSEKSVPILLPLLETDNTLMQSNISKALISVDSPSAITPLCNLLSSPDQNTAMTAAQILTRMTDTTISQKVYDRFKKDHTVNAPAAFVLGQKKFQKAIPELRARLKDTGENGHDEMAEALGWLDDRESIPLLMEVAARNNKQGSAGAIWSLGYLKADEAIGLMVSILKKQDRQLTVPAIFALGEIGNPSTVKPLINLYYESGFQYQMQIALSLAQIGGPEVAEILKTNMESGNPKREKMAGYMLLKSRDPSLAPYAITLLAHPDETIRRYVLGGLKNISGQDFNTIEEWKVWEKQQK